MPPPEPQMYFAAMMILGMAAIFLVLLGVMAWQSTRCLWCNRWLSWKAVKEMKYVCEDKGACNLERFAQQIRKGA